MHDVHINWFGLFLADEVLPRSLLMDTWHFALVVMIYRGRLKLNSSFSSRKWDFTLNELISPTFFDWYLVNLWQAALFIKKNTFDQILAHTSLVAWVHFHCSHLFVVGACRLVKEDKILGESHVYGDLQSTLTLWTLCSSTLSFSNLKVLWTRFDHLLNNCNSKWIHWRLVHTW